MLEIRRGEYRKPSHVCATVRYQTQVAPVSGAVNGVAVPRSLPTILTTSPIRAWAIAVRPYCSNVPSRHG